MRRLAGLGHTGAEQKQRAQAARDTAFVFASFKPAATVVYATVATPTVTYNGT